jgi:hypothetical protein
MVEQSGAEMNCRSDVATKGGSAETPGMSRTEPQQRLLHEAENGDLRPQFNPQAPAAWNNLPLDLASLEPILLDRFFQLARPIADASILQVNPPKSDRHFFASTWPIEQAGLATDFGLHDAGRFFYLIETLKRLGYQGLEATLLMILDDFCQLDSRSYDELYLWSIVQLSRIDVKYARQFWPLIITLDLRYRAANWKRPRMTHVYEQPYRLTDLVFYYYEIYTKDRDSNGLSRFPSLGACLLQIIPDLSSEQLSLASIALGELETAEQRPSYGDALGLVSRFTSSSEVRDDGESVSLP